MNAAMVKASTPPSPGPNSSPGQRPLVLMEPPAGSMNAAASKASTAMTSPISRTLRTAALKSMRRMPHRPTTAHAITAQTHQSQVMFHWAVANPDAATPNSP
jgi:hypothetical protein